MNTPVLADTFAPGEAHFDECLAEWPRERREALAASVTERDVLEALHKDVLHPADFMALLSPVAAVHFRHLHESLPLLRIQCRLSSETPSSHRG